VVSFIHLRQDDQSSLLIFFLADPSKEERMSDEPFPNCPAIDLSAEAQNVREATSPSDGVDINEAARSDPFFKLAIAQHSPESADIRLPLDASYQKGYEKHIEDLRIKAEPLSCHASGRGSILSCAAATVGDSSDDTEGLIERPRTSDQTAKDEIDHDLFQNLLDSDMLDQHSPVSQPQFPLSAGSSPVQLDSAFSHRLPSYIPALLPQQMQPPSTPITSHPSPGYGTIKDYRTGVAFPNRYLDQIRDSVDPNFSNENWGDEYYFGDATPFTYIEDVDSNPHLQTEKEPLHWGMQVRAMAIPWRPEEDIWKSLERAMDRLSGGNGERKLSFPSQQGKRRGIQPITTRNKRHRPSRLDLESRAQAPEQLNFPKPRRVIEWPPLVAPGPPPLPIGTLPLAESATKSEMEVCVERSDVATRGDASLRHDGDTEMGAATAEPEDCSMGE
jgi:hypothetical protein